MASFQLSILAKWLSHHAEWLHVSIFMLPCDAANNNDTQREKMKPSCGVVRRMRLMNDSYLLSLPRLSPFLTLVLHICLSHPLHHSSPYLVLNQTRFKQDSEIISWCLSFWLTSQDVNNSDSLATRGMIKNKYCRLRIELKNCSFLLLVILSWWVQNIHNKKKT